MDVTKIPPHDLDAEQSVLGAMMMSGTAIAQVMGFLADHHFYRQAHALIFKAIFELFQKSEPVDLVTVSSQLKKNNTLEPAGGRTYLVEVMNSVPTAANVERYATIVKEKSMLRQLIDAGSHIVEDAFDDTKDVSVILEEAQKTVMDVAKDQVSDDFVKLDSVLKTVFDDIQKVYDTENRIIGVPSGYTDLDDMLSGFQKSDLIILAARPAMGKTTLALNFATNAALRHSKGVAIFSLEMPKEQLAMRLLASESKVDLKRLKTANLHEHEYKSLMHALGSLSEAPIYIDDTAGLSPMELRAKTRRLQMEHGVDLILIDYLQLMRSSRKKVESRFHEVSEIVREVKGFAKESQVPIIALSQLSRAVEQRTDKKPLLSDLRETGEIEQTADIVMFIHRDDYYDKEMQMGSQISKTDIVIAKHRNGATGEVQLMFKKDISQFLNAEATHVVPE